MTATAIAMFYNGVHQASCPHPVSCVLKHPTSLYWKTCNNQPGLCAAHGRIFKVTRVDKAQGGYRPSFLFSGELLDVSPSGGGKSSLICHIYGVNVATQQLRSSLLLQTPSPSHVYRVQRSFSYLYDMNRPLQSSQDSALTAHLTGANIEHRNLSVSTVAVHQF